MIFQRGLRGEWLEGELGHQSYHREETALQNVQTFPGNQPLLVQATKREQKVVTTIKDYAALVK
jgi:hypothetical protein